MLRLAVLLLCFLLVQELGFQLAFSTFPVASYWPATGVATALLWWSPRRRGRYAALLFLAGAGTYLADGLASGEAIGYSLAHVATAWIAAGLLSGLLGPDPALAAGSRWVLTGLFPSVVVGALAGGVLATTAMVAIGDPLASAQFAWTWFAADTYGALSTVPALEAARHLLRRHLLQRQQPRRPALRDPEVASRVPALVLFAVNLLVLLAALRGAGGFAGIDDSAERMLTVQLIGAGALLTSLIASDLGASRYAALDAARSRLTALEDSIEGIALIGTDGLIQQANTAFADLVGRDREELTGRPWVELLDPGDPAAVHLGELDLRRSRPAAERITRDVVRLAGHTSPRVEVVLVPEHGPDGVPTAVHCFLHDVTEREKATDWVDRVFRLSPELLCVLDEHNRFVRLNPAWTHTFGYPVQVLIGRPLTDLVHPDDLPATVEQLTQVRQISEPVAFQTRYLAADGTFRWVHWNSAADADGSLVYVVAHDVTATKMTEQALSHARDQAIEASQMKSRFLATMSHEIRTPMHGVIGLSELLDGTELDDEQRGYVQGIRKAGGALLSVINDILDFSKIEAGRMTLEETDFAPAELIDQVTTMLEQTARAKGLELVTDIDPGLPVRLLGDPARIRQVLVNLVSNAVKFTDSGSVTVRVDVMERAEAGLPGLVRAVDNGEPSPVPIRLEVSDSGIGMDAAAVSQLFQPFTQADVSTTRVYGGTGLGLAISRELVEAMGGWISVQSSPGEGTTFRIALPLNLPPAGSPTGADDVRAAEERDRSVLGARVLVVEDNDINQTVASGLLRRLGLPGRPGRGRSAGPGHGRRQRLPGGPHGLPDAEDGRLHSLPSAA